MFKPLPKTPELRRPKGFTLIELLVAMSLGLMLLGMGFSLFDQLNNASDVAVTMADVNQNLRAAVNLAARDLITSGAEIPLGGISLPAGGTSTPIKRPGPGVNNFPVTAPPSMAVVTPGAGLGPTAGSGGTALPTDVVTMISVNPLSLLDQFPLTAIAITPTSATITVNAATNLAAGPAQVVPGQLIMLQNSSACLLTATAVNNAAHTITFTNGDVNDVLGLNQFPPTATTGTIAQLPPVAAATTAYHINMITYYLDTSNPQRLMRQVGTGPAQPVALGIDLLQFSYDLLDGVTVNARTVATPNQIRKVNLSVTAEANHPARKSRQYYSNTINTSVTIQNLAYLNKY